MAFELNTVFQEALQDYKNGALDQAEKKCHTILEFYPAFGEAYNLLAVIAKNNNQDTQALQLFRRALKTDPTNGKYLHNVGMILEKTGDQEGAEQHYRKALSVKKSYLPACVTLAKLYRSSGRYDLALSTVQSLLNVQPDHLAAINLKSSIQMALGCVDDAIAGFQQAIAKNPDVAELHYNLANAYLEKDNFPEAQKYYQKCLTINPNYHLAHFATAQLYTKTGDHNQAKNCFKKCLKIKPDFSDAWMGLAMLLQAEGNTENARTYFQNAIQTNAGNAYAYHHLANVLINQGFNEDARYLVERALELKPEFDEALLTFAKLLSYENKSKEASAQYDKLLAVKSKNRLIYLTEYILFKLKNADWNNLPVLTSEIIDRLQHLERQEKEVSLPPPLSLNYLNIKPELHYKLATLFSNGINRKVNSKKELIQAEKSKSKTRIGYISPDFRQHAVGLLLNDAFKFHDRSKVEIYLYHLVSHEDEYTEKFKSSADAFRNLHKASFVEAANEIRKDGIDVLVDLAGYTTYTRPEILALHPAPVQVQFMGYPDTTGSDFISHIVADSWLITPEMEAFYSEKVIRIPNSFFTSELPVGAVSPTKDSLGLPESGFVFCCFNAIYKISPEVFSVWMKLLRNVEGSVLWLSDCPDTVKENLKAHAVQHSVSPDRLLFAKKVPLAEYMASYKCADVFLDTFNYSAGSTAVCALYAGVPVITYAGQTNAARMGASISAAAGITETIALTEDEYYLKAIELASDRQKLNEIKATLSTKKGLLFDLKSSVMALEEALLNLVQHR